ncbi:MAG TPA: zinc ribbon domain-containing protein, partial [Anaerolineales bacterium]|nr:zinc ribbon domain-containing protein [Anaerolineales bacterium]
MPVYAYRCESCGVQFERMQRFSDNPVSVCPECEQQAVRRVIQ